jgi:hypothetical protein
MLRVSYTGPEELYTARADPDERENESTQQPDHQAGCAIGSHPVRLCALHARIHSCRYPNARSHDRYGTLPRGLRAALLLACKEIRKLNFGRADSHVLAVLWRVLRDARAVARNEGFTARVRFDLPVGR